MLDRLLTHGPAQPTTKGERQVADRLLNYGLAQWVTARGSHWLVPTRKSHLAMGLNPVL